MVSSASLLEELKNKVNLLVLVLVLVMMIERNVLFLTQIFYDRSHGTIPLNSRNQWFVVVPDIKSSQR